jgi:hypothetical protein
MILQEFCNLLVIVSESIMDSKTTESINLHLSSVVYQPLNGINVTNSSGQMEWCSEIVGRQWSSDAS